MESPDPIRFFHPERDLERYRRNLPHWDQERVTTFVTFRLADSIPRQCLEEWNHERRDWLIQRGKTIHGDLSEILPELDPEERIEFLRKFGRRFQGFLDDCYGSCVLRRPECAQAMVVTLKYFDAERYDLGEFVVMPNHVHALVAPREGFSLESILKSWKSFSAREINRLTGQSGRLWQSESFDHLVRDAEALRRLERYVRLNPENAKLREGEYIQGRGSMRVG